MHRYSDIEIRREINPDEKLDKSKEDIAYTINKEFALESDSNQGETDEKLDS